MTKDSLQHEPSISKPTMALGALVVSGVMPIIACSVLDSVSGLWIIPVGIAAITALVWSVIK